MFVRTAKDQLLSLANQYPVVTLIGPRQSGKTTLAQHAFPDKQYLSLEDPDIRQFALSDPRAFLEKLPEGGILDEIQRAPELLSYIQTIVDANNKKGFFILTGSHQLTLHESIAQSLAGRTALLKLLPLSMQELLNSDIQLTVDEWLFKGFFPRIHKDGLNPTIAYRNYLETYIERDLRQMINVRDLSQFRLFIKLCAGRVACTVNASSLASEVGVSSQTIQEWLSILEASFLIFRLPPYYENLGKRLIKAPKLYFTDPGLATYLLEIDSQSQLERDPARGNLFENLVVLELYKARFNQGLDPQLYFYRDSNQREVDVIFKQGAKLTPIEIKSGKTFHKDFLKSLSYFQKLAKEKVNRGYLIYAGEHEQTINQVEVINYLSSSKILGSSDG